MKEIIAITVSTKYDDILDIILPENYKYFKEWFIITHENDSETKAIINKYNFDNIKIVYYDFYKDNCSFDKGSAIRQIQLLLQNDAYNDNIILLLDSDICLPTNFLEIIEYTEIKDETLYGTENRYDFYSYNNFINNTPDIRYSASQDFNGYFQLYLNNSKYLYEKSYNASRCDLNFKSLFNQTIIINNLNVKHLGKDGINWDGRKNKDDFRIKN